MSAVPEFLHHLEGTTTGFQSFAKSLERSTKGQTRSANVLLRAALGKEPPANKLLAKKSLPRAALGKVFGEHMESTSGQTIALGERER